MAITKITKITKTPDLAVAYILRNKVEIIKSEDEVNKEIPHKVWKDEKTGKTYVEYYTIASYKDCLPNSPYSAFLERQEKYQGTSKSGVSRSKNQEEPLMYHLKQSFNGFEVDYYTANEIGRKLADEVFGDYVVLITTHGNTDNVHNHLLISAWDSQGKKLNDNLALIRNIRKVSDRLCEEYGLSVLENTREMNLISYKDKDGNTHFYEPTERKNALIQERSRGNLSTDDISSYRNSRQYSKKEKTRITNIEEIVADIQTVLPTCKSYEEMLQKLQDIGYEIRSKKKNGEWLKYVSYKAPTHDKATRDKSLDEDGFYLRENLTLYIAEQERKRLEYESQHSHDTEEVPHGVPYFESYTGDDIDIDDINTDYKTVIENGEYKTVQRPEYERKVIKDTKKIHKEISSDTSMKTGKYKNREEYIKAQRMRIRNNLRCLEYTEKNNLYSYSQMLLLYQNYKSKYDITISNFNQVERTLAQLKELKKIPEKIEELEKRIQKHRSDLGYVLEHYAEDKKLLETYKDTLRNYKIEDAESRKAFFEKIDIIEQKQSINREYITNAVSQMTELENCILTYTRIDSDSGIDTRTVISEFNKLRGLNNADAPNGGGGNRTSSQRNKPKSMDRTN